MNTCYLDFGLMRPTFKSEKLGNFVAADKHGFHCVIACDSKMPFLFNLPNFRTLLLSFENLNQDVVVIAKLSKACSLHGT